MGRKETRRRVAAITGPRQEGAEWPNEEALITKAGAGPDGLEE
jgi:hypothetical protein